jgi:hypothetical protein
VKFRSFVPRADHKSIWGLHCSCCAAMGAACGWEVQPNTPANKWGKGQREGKGQARAETERPVSGLRLLVDTLEPSPTATPSPCPTVPSPLLAGAAFAVARRVAPFAVCSGDGEISPVVKGSDHFSQMCMEEES